MNTGAPLVPHSRSILERLGRTLAAVEDGILVFLLSGMIALAGAQILLRNLWDEGIGWGDPLLRVTVMWIGLLGAMAASRDDNHITIDLVSRVLKGRAHAITRIVTGLVGTVVCAALTWHSMRFVLFEREDQAIAFASVPAWWCELIIPVAFGVMALRFLISALAQLIPAIRGEP
jgi:TRAP-type C4-dicarboxylate transport system permease small subunit